MAMDIGFSSIPTRESSSHWMHVQQAAKAFGGNQGTCLERRNKKLQKSKITARLAGAGKWRGVALEEFVMFSFLSIEFQVTARGKANCKKKKNLFPTAVNSKIPLKLKWNERREIEVFFSQVCKAYLKSSVLHGRPP